MTKSKKEKWVSKRSYYLGHRFLWKSFASNHFFWGRDVSQQSCLRRKKKEHIAGIIDSENIGNGSIELTWVNDHLSTTCPHFWVPFSIFITSLNNDHQSKTANILGSLFAGLTVYIENCNIEFNIGNRNIINFALSLMNIRGGLRR